MNELLATFLLVLMAGLVGMGGIVLGFLVQERWR